MATAIATGATPLARGRRCPPTNPFANARATSGGALDAQRHRAAANTGNRCFFINQEGDLTSTANRGAGAYTGATVATGTHPAFSAAYTAADMASPMAIGLPGVDLNVWVPVQ